MSNPSNPNRDCADQPVRTRSATPPAYYLGRPRLVWLAATGSRSGRSGRQATAR
jgi:hypothetical protein